MIVYAISSFHESARQLRDCLLLYRNHIHEGPEKRFLLEPSSTDKHYISALRSSYLLHAWLTYGEKPSNDQQEAQLILSSAQFRGTSQVYPGVPSESVLEEKVQGDQYQRLQSLKSIEIKTVAQFDKSTLKEKLRLLIQLRKIRDERARIIGFESYFHLRQQHDLSIDLDTIYAFLGSLDQGISDSQLSAVVKQKHEEEYRRVNEFLVEYSLSLEGAFQLIELVLKKELDLTVRRVSSLNHVKDALIILEVSQGPSEIGSILYDLRVSTTKPQGNRTVPITCHGTFGAQAQHPIALCSCHVGAGNFLSFGMLISLFHELGHALDHLLDKKGGLMDRPIDELEVASRYLETLLVKSVSNGTFSEVLSPILTDRYRENIRFTLLRQHVWEMPGELLFANFDLRLYLSGTISRTEHVAKVFEKARCKISSASTITFESMLQRYNVSSIAKYQCANYGYLWSNSFNGSGYGKNPAQIITGGLHASLTKNANRNAHERTRSLLESLTAI